MQIKYLNNQRKEYLRPQKTVERKESEFIYKSLKAIMSEELKRFHKIFNIIYTLKYLK